MAGRSLQQLIRHLRRVAAPGVGLADADLLGRFADQRDEAAFESLVWRHAALVFGVCRRVLGQTEDAEDAFQATFLVLARKAGAVRRRTAVGPWLYRVAERVAFRARSRRRAAAPLPMELTGPFQPDSAEQAELRGVLTDEVMRLPARYRSAVVLRYLEGRTTAEAAAALGCPPGTVLSRLAWARRRLRSRLSARGATLPAVLAAAAADEAAGAVPARWVTAAAGGAAAFAAGGRAGRPAVLALEVLRAMWMTRLRIGSVVVCGVLAAGAGLLVPSLSPGRSEPQEKAVQPPVEVTAVKPTRRTTGESQLYNGRTAASATVDVRSRITSQIEKVSFRPGAKVKRGDLLFELDARAFKPEADRAAAELQRAESQLKGIQNQLTRIEKLANAGNIVDAAEAERARSAVDEARAGLLAAKALWEKARLDLDSTRITAPIDGQAGGTVLGVGNLATPATTLVALVATDPVYVNFDVPEQEIPRLQALLKSHGVTAHIGLGRDEDNPRQGKIEFVDNQVNPQTGTVRVRANLPNTDGTILPGMSAQVRVEFGDPRDELLVPIAAVRRTQSDESFVLVVGKDNIIEWRPIKWRPIKETELRNSEDTVAVSGIKPSDRVITDKRLPPAGAPIRVREAGEK